MGGLVFLSLVVRLDAEVPDVGTFARLDLEGADCEASEGARKLIRSDHPKLAVSVYHDQRDFWRIPEIALGNDVGYDAFLRHYTEGPLETIMCFV